MSSLIRVTAGDYDSQEKKTKRIETVPPGWFLIRKKRLPGLVSYSLADRMTLLVSNPWLFLSLLGIADPEHVLDRVRLSSLQVLESRLDTLETPGNNLLGLRLEPSILQSFR